METHLHYGHRDRMKQRVRKDGLRTFSDHEILEVILYYSIRQGDTNPIGHALLERFGSLDGIMQASLDELCEVKGVGESSAILFRTIAEFTKRYCMQESIDSRERFSDIHQMHAYLSAQFIGENREVVYLLCLDEQMRVLCCELMAKGTVDFCHLNMREVVETILRYQATGIVIAHNHPQGVARPSADDMKTTRLLESTLGTLQLRLFDHLVVSNRQFYSFRQHGDLLER